MTARNPITVEWTANIKVTEGLGAAAESVDLMLQHGPNGALDEFGNHRNGVLSARSRFVRRGRGAGGVRRTLRRKWAPAAGTTWTRPRFHGGPVGRDASRYELLRCYSHRIALPGFMGKLPGRRSFLPGSYVTIAVWFDHLMVREVTDIQYHLTAEVQYGHGYRTDRAHATRVQRHKRETRSLERIVHRHKQRGRYVTARGDSNFHGFEISGLQAASKTHPTAGTLGGHRVTDDVHFDPELADCTGTFVDGRIRSDHKGMGARLREKEAS